MNGEIYDIASYLAYDGTMSYPPVMKGLDIQTKEQYTARYGSPSPHGIDNMTQMILDSSVSTYMNNFPESANGLWDLVKSIGAKIKVDIDMDNMSKKYQDAKWILVQQGGEGK